MKWNGMSSRLVVSSANIWSSYHGQSPSSVPVVSCQLRMNSPTTS